MGGDFFALTEIQSLNTNLARILKMKSNSSWQARVAQILLGVAIVIALVVVRGTKAADDPAHLTTDWSDRHVVFSSPHNLGEHVRLLSNPRYAKQLVRRRVGEHGDPDAWRWRRAPEPKPNLMHRDWSEYLGSGGTVGSNGYPAKFSFDPTTAYCATPAPPQNFQPDFVVYNTGITPSAAGTFAFTTETFTSIGATSGQTFVIANANLPAEITLTATTGAGSNTGTNFLVATSTTVAAGNLAAAIARNGAAVGVTATSAGAVVTITSLNTGVGSVGDAVDVEMTATVTGLTVTTPLVGGSGGASIVAYDNLYSGCTGTVPSVYWAYDTGGVAATSPVLSGKGDQVAFVQNAGAGVTGQLVILRWKSSTTDTVDAPNALLTAVTNANYPTCTAPCYTTLQFPAGGTISDNNSSPFYDFAHDVLYVGDDGGHLRRFNNVFKGTTVNPPAQATTGGFPVAITGGGVLTGPVFDDGSGKVFVASDSGILTAVLASSGAQTQSAVVGGNHGIFDAPLLDVTNENVYVVTSDTNSDTTGKYGIYQFPAGAGFTAGTGGNETVISDNSPGSAVFSGTFDNAFYSGSTGGNMYVCGPAGGSNTPTLYQIAVSSLGILGAVNEGPALTTSATGPPLCSPVTESYNPNIPQDLIYLSVTALGQTAAPVRCSTNAGCLMSFDVTSGAAITDLTPTTATIPAPGGASGVIVDNYVGSGTLAGASQVYYTPLGYGSCASSYVGAIGGCAVQASQAAFH